MTDLPITIDATVDDLFVFRLARGRNLTFYDATYLALALRCRVPLATLDGALIAAANVEHVRLVGRR